MRKNRKQDVLLKLVTILKLTLEASEAGGYIIYENNIMSKETRHN